MASRPKRSPQQAADEIRRLCDHYKLPHNNEGVARALFRAIGEGTAQISLSRRTRGRPAPFAGVGEYLIAISEGREPSGPPPSVPKRKWDEQALRQLFIEIVVIKYADPAATERQIADRVKPAVTYATFRRRKYQAERLFGRASPDSPEGAKVLQLAREWRLLN
jgi:hypothetical protein